ncbi:type III toxin-antitoxin system ToxN/AbiQ family toxin, partial [Mycobacterium tuberculosis]|nr:type III toxin-antitoxin system ToxN/AbiQ family toxin [Mycobacterium tuberculosis]
INDSYGRMLQNQYEYILHYQEKIQKQANKLYEIANKKDNSFLTNLTCDFKSLEVYISENFV